MTKPMRIMLICVAILFGGIFGYKAFISYEIKKYIAAMSPVVTVSTTKVHYTDWQPKVEAAGSLRAIRGVNVTTELAGIVQTIAFTPGAHVKQGDVLIQLNADAENAQLRSLQANAELAKSIYKRDKAQYAIGAISKAALDTDLANVKSDDALAAQQAATAAKKTIRAPFTGRLGICQVNPGQYLSPGNNVVSLQTLDPIYVDFYLPQQELVSLKVGQTVTMKTNSFPNEVFTGKISTIDSALDPTTRNVEVEATLPNPKEQLTPGMFGAITVDLGSSTRYLTLPQTAISFNSYGNIVYVVEHDGNDKDGKPQLIAKQKFVVTGETRGDQITILKGLNEGDEVVSSGQVKLKNGAKITINNKVVPDNNPAPDLTDE